MAGVIVMQKLDFHLRHIDTRRTFATAAFATDTELHRLVHLSGGESLGSQLALQSEAQGVGSSAGEVFFLSGCPIRRAHHFGIPFTARAIVVAHLYST